MVGCQLAYRCKALPLDTVPRTHSYFSASGRIYSTPVRVFVIICRYASDHHSSIVVLVAQVVNTSWISYRLTNDAAAKRIYDEVVVKGTCGYYDILGGSWQHGKYYVVGRISWL